MTAAVRSVLSVLIKSGDDLTAAGLRAEALRGATHGLSIGDHPLEHAR